jgi:hypothetical protein
LVFAIAAIAAPSMAFAHGGDDSGGLQLPNDVRTVTPDGARAKEILARIEKDAAASLLVKEPVGKTKRALQRADGASASGDTDGARLLSRLALGHATNASETLRAIDAEKKSNEAQAKTLELRDKLVRTRTLLAETQAQRGQVTAELARAEEDAKANADKSRSKEDDRIQKGEKANGPKKGDHKTDKSSGPKSDPKPPTKPSPKKAP